MKRFYIILFFSALCLNLGAQDKKIFSFNGYVSVMPSVMFDSLSGKIYNQELLHNRLNFKAYAGDKFSFGLELRNRIFMGNLIGSTPGYAAMTGSDAGLLDLSFNLADSRSFLFNSTIDRYWIDYNSGKFQARIGRQRINWGQTLVWNPNDIFNPYTVFDVDYAERPGCDAVRLQYFPSASSAVELAVKEDSEKKLTAAALWRFNKWGYDIQAIAGYAGGHDFIAGAGWSGAIGTVSFRGEATWFRPVGRYSDSTSKAIVTVGADKMFADNSMIQVQIMYCNDPLEPAAFASFYTGSLSAKDLAFSKFSAFIGGTVSLSPLVKVTISGMAIPDMKGWFAGPSLDWSLSSSLDLSVIWQYFKANMGGTAVRNNLGFLRLKYSF